MSEIREDGALVYVDFQRSGRPVNDNLSKTQGFHEIFGLPVLDAPGFPTMERVDLRLKMLDEELTELKSAIGEMNLTKVLDALVDLEYVLHGTTLEFGLHCVQREAYQEVHRANMRKLDPNGHPILREDGKVVKPEGWQPPDLESLLLRAIAEINLRNASK